MTADDRDGGAGSCAAVLPPPIPGPSAVEFSPHYNRDHSPGPPWSLRGPSAVEFSPHYNRDHGTLTLHFALAAAAPLQTNFALRAKNSYFCIQFCTG